VAFRIYLALLEVLINYLVISLFCKKKVSYQELLKMVLKNEFI